MNNVAILNHSIMHLLQRQNIKREIYKKKDLSENKKDLSENKIE